MQGFMNQFETCHHVKLEWTILRDNRYADERVVKTVKISPTIAN